jgi:hypothetical protein
MRCLLWAVVHPREYQHLPLPRGSLVAHVHIMHQIGLKNT